MERATSDMPVITRHKRPRGRNLERDAEVVRLWESGMPAADIARTLGVARVNVYRRLNRVLAEQEADAAVTA